MSSISLMDDLRHVRPSKAAALSGLGESTIRRLVKAGRVGSRRHGSRTVLVSLESLNSFLRTLPSAADLADVD